MAKGKKTGGKDFKPGNKIGQGGAAHNPELKRIRRLTHGEVSEVGSMLLDGDIEAIEAISVDPKAKILKLWMAKIALRGIDRGDPQALSVILDRIVGKVKDELHVTQDNPFETMSIEERIKAGEELIKTMKAERDKQAKRLGDVGK